ncbi:Methyltransferase type 11 [Magnetococcus marinus MC-1]|uniref:Methyltransferase type 11 n=1 Tax=Magnetococcus marinus (strain ATCC BAA-1437 / JCM 17883 / MC-1) TaxID=156889 RepID=A0L557_MAGMM|nr:methyltransferase domain-containing protein [Magnetococcus marinus]ABK43100.1 Methyltransferase type 11 [Magnetococcus marinus MC-1]
MCAKDESHTLSPQRLAMLCCPDCRGELTHQPEVPRLWCPACNHRYPIVEGIPVLLPGDVEATIEARFHRYWDTEEKSQLYNQKVEGDGDPFGIYNHESEIYGMEKLLRPQQQGRILDAGCGNGRMLARFSAQTDAVGIDASLNLLRIVKRAGRGSFHVCCELEQIPFKDGLFDTVFSCRVLQHLTQQQQAVQEMSRVTKPGGDLVLELYNSWNLKALYKNLRMSKTWAPRLNAPFRAIFRSMSPFQDWGIDYDRYNHWFQVKRWLQQADMHQIQGRGVGFGYHKYLLQPFYIDAVLRDHAPRLLSGYYAFCFRLERLLGHLPPFRWGWEKFVIRGTRHG